MAEIQGFTHPFLFRVFGHHFFFHLHGFFQQCGETGTGNNVSVYRQQLFQMLPSPQQTVLQHLGETGKNLPARQGFQENRIDQDLFRDGKSTYLIFEAVKIDSRFSSHGSVHLRQQGRRDIDASYPPFETGSGKSADIRHHSSADIDQKRVSPGPPGGQYFPDPPDAFQRLVIFSGRNGYDAFFPDFIISDHRPTVFPGILIRQYKNLTRLTGFKRRKQSAGNIRCKQNRIHSFIFYKDSVS